MLKVFLKVTRNSYQLASLHHCYKSEPCTQWTLFYHKSMKLFLHSRLNGTGFTVRHYIFTWLPTSVQNYFCMKTCNFIFVQSMHLPMPHEDSKCFYKFFTTVWRWILKSTSTQMLFIYYSLSFKSLTVASWKPGW